MLSYIGYSIVLILLGTGFGYFIAKIWEGHREYLKEQATESARKYFANYGGRPGDFLVFPNNDNPCILEIRDSNNSFAGPASHVTDGIMSIPWDINTILPFFKTYTPTLISRDDPDQRQEYQEALRDYLLRLERWRNIQFSGGVLKPYAEHMKKKK